MPRLQLNAALAALALLGAGAIAASCGTPSHPPGISAATDTGTGGTTSTGNQGGAGVGGEEQGGGGDTGAGGMLPGCGDGMIVPPEQCDGSDLDGRTCADFGFDSGTLGCSPNNCQFSFSKCAKKELCSNAIDDNLNGLIDCKDPDCAAACADSCSAAAIVSTPPPPYPFEITGYTLGHANQLNASCSSKGMMSGPEVVYELTATITGVLDLKLQSGTDLSISVRSQCDAPAELGCADKGGPGAVERLKVPIASGQKVFIVVQGHLPDDAGVFDLVIDDRPIVCGDGSLDGDEGCDDGNLAPGDGCSAACALEPTESEPNGTTAGANLYTSPWFASIAPAGDVDVVKVTVAKAPSTLAAKVLDFDGHSCADHTLDSIMEILDKDGSTVLVLADDMGASSCSGGQATGLGVGTYFVRVKASPIATPQTFPYKLEVKVTADVCGDNMKTGGEQCDDGNLAAGDGCGPTCLFELTEVEPNGTPATANPYKDPWHSAIQSSGDVDVVSVVVPAGQSTLSADVIDFGTGDCVNQKIVSRMEIVDKDATTILASNNGSDNFCAGASVENLSPGKYYVRIKASQLAPNLTFSYGLQIKVQ